MPPATPQPGVEIVARPTPASSTIALPLARAAEAPRRSSDHEDGDPTALRRNLEPHDRVRRKDGAADGPGPDRCREARRSGSAALEGRLVQGLHLPDAVRQALHHDVLLAARQV